MHIFSFMYGVPVQVFDKQFQLSKNICIWIKKNYFPSNFSMTASHANLLINSLWQLCKLIFLSENFFLRRLAQIFKKIILVAGKGFVFAVEIIVSWLLSTYRFYVHLYRCQWYNYLKFVFVMVKLINAHKTPQQNSC